MVYIVRMNGSQITLQPIDDVAPVAIVDLVRLHQIWREQDSYKQIRAENDEYERGLRTGNLQYVLPTIAVNTDNIKRKIPFLPPKFKIEIGFINGRHRLDAFYRMGARILPVHATSIESAQNIEHHLGASRELIETEWINRPGRPL
ncbi:hypothetical protein [Lichenibacterium ramalinae]|uniref:hypothetical protein n=1 Tax=Lichenibacterium ramalinae TaxID=2316527 RepID=UPI00100E7979|nr:hypothetical protein [Lichenibacterium ramalinae]